MTITPNRIVATATAVVGCAGILAAAPAQAATHRLSVNAVTSPLWSAGSAVPVDVVVTNPDAQLLCDTVNVRLSWRTPNGKLHGVSEAGRPVGGTWAGNITIPARSVRPGSIRYTVHATETCGIILTTVTYVGNSPTSVIHVMR